MSHQELPENTKSKIKFIRCLRFSLVRSLSRSLSRFLFLTCSVLSFFCFFSHLYLTLCCSCLRSCHPFRSYFVGFCRQPAQMGLSSQMHFLKIINCSAMRQLKMIVILFYFKPKDIPKPPLFTFFSYHCPSRVKTHKLVLVKCCKVSVRVFIVLQNMN